MPKPNCPVCKNSLHTINVQELYFGLMENDPSMISKLSNSPFQKKNLYRKLHPPVLDRQPIWQIIAPVIIAAIILFFMLFLSIVNLLNRTENAVLYSSLSIIAFFIFLVFRKKINTAFQAHTSEREELVVNTAQKVELWSGLWICLLDGTIYNSDHTINLPLDKFQSLLAN